MRDKCYACLRPLRTVPYVIYLEDDNAAQQLVGPCCYRKIKEAGKEGYRPPLGGPALYYIREDSPGYREI